MVFFTESDLTGAAHAVMDRESQRGQGVLAYKALATALCEEGKAGASHILAHISGSGIAEDINSILSSLPKHQIDEFVNYWSAIFVGVAAPAIMEIPFHGWSTKAFYDDFENRISGTQIPPLRHLEASTPETDRQLETRITPILIKQGRVGYFFESWDRLSSITPIAVALQSYGMSFKDAVVATGTSFQKVLMLMPEGAPKHA